MKTEMKNGIKIKTIEKYKTFLDTLPCTLCETQFRLTSDWLATCMQIFSQLLCCYPESSGGWSLCEIILWLTAEQIWTLKLSKISPADRTAEQESIKHWIKCGITIFTSVMGRKLIRSITMHQFLFYAWQSFFCKVTSISSHQIIVVQLKVQDFPLKYGAGKVGSLSKTQVKVSVLDWKTHLQ